MVTREQLHELAQFEDEGACALSFYFQPAAPRNKAHKEDAILTKDLAREALRHLPSKGKCEAAHADLDRIVRLSQELRGNHAHAKAVFACGAQGFWREYDLPAQLSGTQLRVDRHFHLKPLAQSLEMLPSLRIVLVDRHRARLFDLRLGELTEREGFFHPAPRPARNNGHVGYDAGHVEHRAADETRHHFKFVAELLQDALDRDKEKNIFESWIVGCQEAHWSHFEPHLHPYVAQKMLGRFSADAAHTSREEIRAQADRIFAEARQNRCQEALRETLHQARQNARGVTGLRRVLRSLELGEVQTLLLGQSYRGQAVECSGCGHLDAHLVNFCPVCGRETRAVVDVGEAILPGAIRHDIELLYIKDDPEFDKVGNIGALLRFRSERSNNMRSITDAPPNPSLSRRAGPAGRYRASG
jgi:peptide chain release factor subunit 1